MSSSDGRYWLTFNGEIYNYRELRVELEAHGAAFQSHTDTEVILWAYKIWGPQCVHKFNGMWAFAIFDCEKKRLFLSRDRFGVKPMYFADQNGRFGFASEIKLLRALGFGTGRAHKEMTGRYLLTGLTDDTRDTMFEGVQRLLPGECLTWDLAYFGQKFRIERFYQLSTVDTATDQKEWVAGIRDLLTDSVKLRLRADVPAGSCLSGGLDSSSIVCAVQKLEPKAAQYTFTSCFKDKGFDESPFANQVIEQVGANPKTIFPNLDQLWEGDLERLVWHQDEPFNSTSVYAQWNVMLSAKSAGVKVLLDGQGADELFGGYHKYLPQYLGGLIWKGRFCTVLSNMKQMRETGLLQQAGSPLRLLASATAKGFGVYERRAEKLKSLFREPTVAEMEWPEAGLKANLVFDLFHSLQPLLRYEDRNSMAHSIEARTPFLDYRLVEWVMGGREAWFYEGGWTKSPLREAMRGLLPEKVRLRVDKMGFATPETQWYERHAPKLRSEILDSSSELWAWLDREEVRQELQSKPLAKLGFAPWRWFMFNRWMKTHGLTA